MMSAAELLRKHRMPAPPVKTVVVKNKPTIKPGRKEEVFLVNGVEMTAKQAAKIAGVSVETMRARLKANPDKAFRPKGKHIKSKAPAGGITDIMRRTGISSAAACYRKRHWPKDKWYLPKGG